MRMARAAWPSVSLGEVLRQRAPDVEVARDRKYEFAGVYSFGRGIFRSGSKNGMEVSYQRLSRLLQNDFVYPKLMAWEGAFGVVPAACVGLHVSPEFPVFSVLADRLDAAFLDYYFRRRSVWSMLTEASTGTNVRRRRLHPTDFLKHKIPLPPIAEQRRIVQRIGDVADRVECARRLSVLTAAASDSLVRSGARQIVAGLGRRCGRRLGDVVEIRGGGTPDKGNPAYWSGAIPWVSPKDMKVRRISDAIDHISEEATRRTPARLLPVGAVLVVVRGMILVHTVPIAVLEVPATINQDMKALIPHSGLQADYLCSVLWALNADLLALVERSTHDTRKLQTDALMSLEIPVPSVAEQQRIVARLDALQAEGDVLTALQGRAAAELDALLPSVLGKAFRGDL